MSSVFETLSRAMQTSTDGASIGRTLADCNAVASLFDNTCDMSAGPIDLNAHAGETMQCSGQMWCPNASSTQTYTTSSPCEFTRKLCVTCSETNGQVYIRAQSNQMPNHCFQATNATPTPINSDFTVLFNRDVTGQVNYAETSYDTSAEVTELLCDIQRTAEANMLAGSGYSETSWARRNLHSHPPPPPDGGDGGGGGGGGSSLSVVSGIMLSGTLMYNALAADSNDAV